MAVLGESEQEGMVKSFQSSNCSRGFYSGHTDRRTEGLWRSEDSGQEVTGLRWRPGQPDDHLGVEDCGFYSVDTGDLVDHVCSWQFCPLCRMEDLVEFQLVGSCLNIADTLYLMLNSSYLLGYINTALHRDTVTNQWQIVNTFNNSLIAVMDGLDSFPLGSTGGSSCRQTVPTRAFTGGQLVFTGGLKGRECSAAGTGPVWTRTKFATSTSTAWTARMREIVRLFTSQTSHTIVREPRHRGSRKMRGNLFSKQMMSTSP